jgi:hypothetical protein
MSTNTSTADKARSDVLRSEGLEKARSVLISEGEA